jgi:hypothetical protein
VFQVVFSRSIRAVIPPIVRALTLQTMVRPSAGCRPSARFQLFLLKVNIAMIKVARKIRKPEILCVHIDTLTYILRYLLDES